MVIQDTPGLIINCTNYLERRTMYTLNKAVYFADCILALMDASDKLEEIVAIKQAEMSVKLPPICVIVNKIDTIPKAERALFLEYIQKIFNTETIFECSAIKGYGLEKIKSWALSNLPLSSPLYSKEFVASQPERFFVSEQVREKILELYSQEIPYSCQVNVVEFVERPQPKKFYLILEIWVEKNSQKRIILGRKGNMIKKLSKISRESIENFLNTPIFLSLRVKVRDGWRKNNKIINKLGY